eukprot:356917-Chlamydomonas_euryale.AAC.16
MRQAGRANCSVQGRDRGGGGGRQPRRAHGDPSREARVPRQGFDSVRPTVLADTEQGDRTGRGAKRRGGARRGVSGAPPPSRSARAGVGK